jgi:mRNA interferase RelE/StbE
VPTTGEPPTCWREPPTCWRLETTATFDREFRRLDRTIQKRVLAYLLDVVELPDPRLRGKGLTANRSGQWRYRVGDYRILTAIDDMTLVVLALAVGHRREVY